MTSDHRILRFLRKMAQRFSYSTSYYNDSNSTSFVSRCKVTKKIRPSKFQYTYNFVGYKVVRLWGFEDLGVQECNAFFFLFSHRTRGTDERAGGEPSLAWAIPGEEEEGEAKSRNFFEHEWNEFDECLSFRWQSWWLLCLGTKVGLYLKYFWEFTLKILPKTINSSSVIIFIILSVVSVLSVWHQFVRIFYNHYLLSY